MNIKTLFLMVIALLYFGQSLHSQVTINSTHMPQAGDTLRFSVAAFDSIVLATYADTGANKVWTYDSVIPLRQGLNEFLNSSQTPYPVNGKIAEKLADTLTLSGISLYDVYNFYTNNSNTYQIDQRGARVPFGTLTVPISPNYSDPDQVYEFPLDYQDRDSNSFNFTFNNIFPPAYYSSSGYRINEVEAWGSITTPYGTFNCLKVKTDIVAYDTVAFGNINFGDSTHSREYKWISPQLKIPAMILSGNVVNGFFIPVNLQYRDSARNVPGIFTPLALFRADTTELSLGDTLQLNNLTLSILPPTYNWSITPSTFNYVNGTNSNSQNPFILFSDTGYYDIQLIADNGQGIDTLLREDYIHVNQAVSLIEHKLDKFKLTIFPNPITDNTLFIRSTEKIEIARLYDLHFRLIAEWNIHGKKDFNLTIDQELAETTYFLQLKSKDEEVIKKILTNN